MKWSDDIIADRGIITAVDHNLDWLLKPWFENIRRHSNLPVCVFDLGMSKDVHEWAKKHMHMGDAGNTMLMPDKDKKVFGWQHGWKPFVIMRSLFKETLFLDVDCEVMGDIEPMFPVEHSNNPQDDFAIVRDQLFHNSGVIVAKHGSELVERWAKIIMDTDPTDWRTGDQEILSKVMLDTRDKGVCHCELDDKYNRLIPGDREIPKGTVIAHHRLPQTIRFLKTKSDDSFCIDVWIRDSKAFTLCEWAHEPIADKGIVIGVNKDQEWMLPWWFENYRKHNDYPVLVADFGLTEEGAKWCFDNGFAISPRINLQGTAWFKKPLGCLQSVFKRTIWLDTDCQVKKSLDPIFEYSKDGHIGLTVDRGTPQKYKDALPWDATVYNSGCISFNHRCDIIQKWAMMTLVMLGIETRQDKLIMPAGDQETLALAIRRYGKDKIIEIPKEEMALRLGGDPDDSIVKHWTGPVGKQEIKRQIQDSTISANTLKMVDKSAAIETKGVLVGMVAPRTEWLLRWWLKNYDQNNQIPLAILDDGMSAESRKLCEQHGIVVRVKSSPKIEGWWNKPWALSQTPFDLTLFLELDCEVMGNLSVLFELQTLSLIYERKTRQESLVKNRHFYDTRWWKNVPDMAVAFDAGIILYRKNEEQCLLRCWQDSVLKANRLPALWDNIEVDDPNAYVGDNEILAKILHSRATWIPPPKIFPKKYCTNKYHEYKGETLVLHRTGGGLHGKDGLRSRIAPQAFNRKGI